MARRAGGRRLRAAEWMVDSSLRPYGGGLELSDFELSEPCSDEVLDESSSSDEIWAAGRASGRASSTRRPGCPSASRALNITAARCAAPPHSHRTARAHMAELPPQAMDTADDGAAALRQLLADADLQRLWEACVNVGAKNVEDLRLADRGRVIL